LLNHYDKKILKSKVELICMVCVGGNYYNLKIVRKNNKNIYLRVSEDTITVTCPMG